jgi:hypothetical protein
MCGKKFGPGETRGFAVLLGFLGVFLEKVAVRTWVYDGENVVGCGECGGPGNGQKELSMIIRRTHMTRIVLLVFVLIASGLAALSIASTVLASESPMTHEQYMRMCTARNALWNSFWLFQIPIVWLIFRGLRAYRRLLQIPISLLGAVLCSLGGGFLLFFIAEHGWYRLARQFK